MDVREMSGLDVDTPRGTEDGSAADSAPLGRLCCHAHVALALMWLQLVALPSSQPDSALLPDPQLQVLPLLLQVVCVQLSPLNNLEVEKPADSLCPAWYCLLACSCFLKPALRLQCTSKFWGHVGDCARPPPGSGCCIADAVQLQPANFSFTVESYCA